MTLKTFSAVLTHIVNICVKFYWNPSFKCGGIGLCEIVVNGWMDGWLGNFVPPPPVVGGGTKIYCEILIMQDMRFLDHCGIPFLALSKNGNWASILSEDTDVVDCIGSCILSCWSTPAEVGIQLLSHQILVSCVWSPMFNFICTYRQHLVEMVLCSLRGMCILKT